MSEIQIDQLYLKDVLRRKSETGAEDTHYSVFYTGVPDEYKRLAAEELNETDENKKEGLRKLKNFMKKENLSCTDDELVTVLRCCKYDFKKSETKLKKYLNCRRDIAEKLCQVDEDKIELILDDLMVSMLPYRDAKGRAVLVSRPSVNLDVYSMYDVQSVGFSLALYLLSFPLTTICGLSYIMECKCDSIWVFYPIVKTFRRNIMRFVFLNGHTYENLHKVYHPDLLPQEFEGNLPPINDKFYRERLLNFLKQLKAEGQGANGSGD